MEPFIKKHEYNFIKQCLFNLNNTFRGCIDNKIVETNKIYLQNKILNQFSNLSEVEKEILSIDHITDPQHIDIYIKHLDKYVYGMAQISDSQISKLFKKEKKLKFPSLEVRESKNSYLGWIDEATRKLFIIHNMAGKNIGMSCRIVNQNSNTSHICSFCNNAGSDAEIAFVSTVCKTNSKYGNYKSIGFSVCLDSQKCNNQITSLEKLEKILKEANNII